MRTKLFFLFLLTSSLAFSQQKIGFYDSNALIDQIPESKDVQTKLDQIADDWKKEIVKMKTTLDNKFKDFRQQSLLYSDEVKKQKEDEIIAMEQQIADYQNKKFGVNGELFQKQNDLMKPIQNSIFNAIKAVAEEEKFDYVFDRAGQVMIMYANPTLDLTDKILKRIRSTGIETTK
jgi:outer membrane protein